MIETVIAVLVISFLFFGLLRLSHMLLGKIMLEHAAMRVSRARCVGFNDFMCLKAARVAAIPAAGRRLWPEDWRLGPGGEAARVRTYMECPDEPRARGLLEYEGWSRMWMSPGDGSCSRVGMRDKWWTLEGEAGIAANCAYYME